MIYIITCILFYFLLRQDKFSYNIPNVITNYRLIINCFILILVMNINYYNHYLLLVLSVISLLLDGVDGYLSRFLKQQTDFGETFDQEVDNFLIFILSFSLVSQRHRVHLKQQQNHRLLRNCSAASAA